MAFAIALRRRAPSRPFLALCLAWIAVTCAAAERAPGEAAIASAHPLATAAGREMLDKGGNAFDAAVAVAAALAVVEPSGSGLTGGGFFLVHRARDGRDVMIDVVQEFPGGAVAQDQVPAGSQRQGFAVRGKRRSQGPGGRQ